jgi:hypothetical protein
MRTEVATSSLTTDLMSRAAFTSSSNAPYWVWPVLLMLLGLVLNDTKVIAADVLTQRGSIERTGTYIDSKIDQQLVADHDRWGLVGTLPIQGTVYAQPLYVENLAMPGGGSRNVVFVASALNVVSAFDAGTLAQLWGPVGLGPNDKTTLGHPGCDGISDNFSGEGIGIEATPVIDRGRKRMIISYRTNSTGVIAAARQQLAAIELTTGRVIHSVEIVPPAQGPPWHIWHRSRASLLLLNDVVYVAFGARCEDPGTPTFHGWVIAFSADTLQQVGAFSPTAGNSAFRNSVDGGGIWQGSSGLAADQTGDIYLMTGNRRLEGCNPSPCDAFPMEEPNLADSFVRLRPAIQRDTATGQIVRVDIEVRDWFTPYRKIWLDHEDLDLGSAGPVLLPNTTFLVGGGKQGVMYLLDRQRMGRLDNTPPFDGGQFGKIHQFDTYDQWPDESGRDHVVQKFQAGINQYINGMHSKPGAPVAVAKQNDQQLDAFVVGSNGAIWVTWEVNDGPWSDWFPQPPAEITPTGFAPVGAYLAAAKQNDHQLDVFVVGHDGAIWVTWEINDGRWTDGGGGQPGPARITPSRLAPPGACVTAIKQNNQQLDAFVVGNDGAIYVTWEVNDGHWADGTPGQPGPARITPTGLAPAGSCVAAAKQNNQQLDAFVVGNDGAIYVTWEVNDGRWADGGPGQPGPARITPSGLAPAPACVAAIKQNQNQLDAFMVSKAGAIWVTWEVNDGRWADGGPGGTSPARLTPALRMHEWIHWPHIHGSPVFAQFGNAGSFLYVWPEKDHLKAFPWQGNRFDIDHRILGRGLDGQLVLTPPGPPFGMPGGMLSVTINPSQARSGVLFASVVRFPNQTLGLLRAFDPFTLRELWNNAGRDYRFAKFVAPTIADGKVFLPTAGPSNEVLVYGRVR